MLQTRSDLSLKITKKMFQHASFKSFEFLFMRHIVIPLPTDLLYDSTTRYTHKNWICPREQEIERERESERERERERERKRERERAREREREYIYIYPKVVSELGNMMIIQCI